MSIPGFVGVFEGILYNTGGPDLKIRLESQLLSQTETAYTFGGTVTLEGQTYTMSGRERGSGVRYHTPAPQGSILASLSQSGTAVYCLSLGIGYYAELPPQGVMGQLRRASPDDSSECAGEFVGSISAQRMP